MPYLQQTSIAWLKKKTHVFHGTIKYHDDACRLKAYTEIQAVSLLSWTSQVEIIRLAFLFTHFVLKLKSFQPHGM